MMKLTLMMEDMDDEGLRIGRDSVCTTISFAATDTVHIEERNDFKR